MQRTQPTKGCPGQIEIERGISKLQSCNQTNRKARNTPKHSCDGAEFHGTEIVIRLAVNFLRNRVGCALFITRENGKDSAKAGHHKKRGMESISRLPSARCNERAQGSQKQENNAEAHLRRCHPFRGKGGVLHDRPFIGPARDR